MEKSFLEYYDFYEGVCKERLHLQGQNMQVTGVVVLQQQLQQLVLDSVALISNYTGGIGVESRGIYLLMSV